MTPPHTPPSETAWINVCKAIIEARKAELPTEALRGLEAGAVALAPHVRPSSSCINLALKTLSAEVFEALFVAHKDQVREGLTSLRRRRIFPMETLVLKAPIWILRLLRDEGFSFAGHSRRLQNRAADEDDPEMARLAMDLSSRPDVALLLILSQAGTRVSAALTNDALRLAQDRNKGPNAFEIAILQLSGLDASRSKMMAMSLAAGVPPNTAELLWDKTCDPRWLPLLRTPLNNHGRLKLAALEPDPTSVFLRPFESEFYGISACDTAAPSSLKPLMETPFGP